MRERKFKAIPAGTPEDTRAKLYRIAIGLFADHGYEGTSTKQICEAAGANIAALHYHFHTKESLYLLILQEFGTKSLESALRVLQRPERNEEVRIRLELFLHETIELFMKNYNLVRIVQREGDSIQSHSEKVFFATFGKIFEALVEFITQAVDAKFLSKEIDPFLMAGSIFSLLSAVIRNEPTSKKYYKRSILDTAYRKKWVQSTVSLVLDGALPRAPRSL